VYNHELDFKPSLQCAVLKFVITFQAEAKQQEYENLVQLKDADVRAAQEEKDTMLKAMREALAVASAKKEEFDAKLEKVEEKHANEMKELRKQYEVELTNKMVQTELSNIEVKYNDTTKITVR